MGVFGIRMKHHWLSYSVLGQRPFFSYVLRAKTFLSFFGQSQFVLGYLLSCSSSYFIPSITANPTLSEAAKAFWRRKHDGSNDDGTLLSFLAQVISCSGGGEAVL